MEQKPVIYTRAEVADILKVSLTTIGRAIKEGELYAFKAGRQVRIPDYALQDYLDGVMPVKPMRAREHSTDTWPPTPSIFDVLEEDQK